MKHRELTIGLTLGVSAGLLANAAMGSWVIWTQTTGPRALLTWMLIYANLAAVAMAWSAFNALKLWKESIDDFSAANQRLDDILKQMRAASGPEGTEP